MPTMTFRLVNVAGRAALTRDDAYFDLERVSEGQLGSDPMAAIAQVELLHELDSRLPASEPDGPLDGATLDAPIPRPRNCYGIGLNYRSHAAESDMELPQTPLVFTKFPSCLVGPTSDVELRTSTGDYEVEVVVVIGTTARDVAAADAWEHVAGITCGQDISDRALQFSSKPPHFDLGKSRDTFGPTGPVLVSTDHFADPTKIDLSCRVNGEERQRDNTSNLIFSVADLIEYLSSISTLIPGDLIFTGTPEGVGAATRNYLKPGDVIESTVEGVGTMTNRCV